VINTEGRLTGSGNTEPGPQKGGEIMTMTAKDILRCTEPGEIFPADPAAIKAEYTRLAKIWHPDCNGNSAEATEVMIKINALYERAMELTLAGKWRKPGFLKLRCRDGKVRELKYRKEQAFELGTMYICDSVVIYLVEGRYKDLYINAEQMIKRLKFADAKMKAEMSKCLPEIISQFETMDGQLGMVFKKDPDMLLLEDVLAYYNGRVPDRHVAWILGTLYNLACYLDYAGITINAISTATYFISPKWHCGAILGGWWFAVPAGAKMLGVPEKIFDILPPAPLNTGYSSIQTDLEAIRLIGRELLGDRTGMRLEDYGVPGPLAVWLRGASAGSAFEEYARWGRVLDDSYGARVFVKMELDADKVYAK
jgi:hypothetical protein